MSRAVFLALASGMLVWPQVSFAQQSIEYASVGGRVTDVSGAVVQGASVTVRQLETNVTAVATADRDGRFRLPYLRAGRYEVIVRQVGFREERSQLTLTAGAAFELPVSLTVAGVDAHVTVAAEAPVIETARSQIAGTVSEAELEGVPLNGRGFLSLALLVPGVAPANLSSTQLFPETSAVPGVSLSIGGQRNLSNNVMVDGLSANDDAAGLSGITYGIDAVDQMQVVTSGGQAELGRALGGYVNVVTRSGTNALHGTAYNYFRDDRLNEANHLTGTNLPMRQWQFGASVGGPIIRDRAFYFVNAERRNLDQSGVVAIDGRDAETINARLAAAGYRGPRVDTGVYANPVDTTNLFGRADHQASGRQQLGVRYSLYAANSRNARGVGALAAPSASSGLDNLDQAVAASGTRTLSARTVLESRAQFAHSDFEAPPADAVGPAVNIAGVASFGTLSSSPTARLNRMFQVVTNISHQAGAHALKAGVDVLHNDNLITFPRTVRGAYVFGSMAAFLAGAYNNAGYSQTFGVNEIGQRSTGVGGYVQDEWKAGSRLTLNAGLRYDLQFLETIAVDADNVSPRAGLAWTPFESRRTIVRAGAGVFFDRVPLRALANALLSAGNTTDLGQLRQITISLSPSQAGAPTFPAVLDGVLPSVTLPALTTMDRHLQNASSRQASVELEQQVGQSLTVSAGYQYLRGRHLLIAVNQNVPGCLPAGANNGCRPNPQYGNNMQYSSAGASAYHAMQVSIVQRPAAWGHYRLSYTLSSAKNNVGEFFFSAPIDPFDLQKDWGRADSDQRHRLALSGAVQSSMAPAASAWERLSHGFRLSATLQAYSPPPLNITSGITTIQGTAGRPVVRGTFIERNSGEGSGFFSLDARLSRTFHVSGRLEAEGLIEVFNLTNRRNELARNAIFGAGSYPSSPATSFGRVTAVGHPRSFQLGARVRF